MINYVFLYGTPEKNIDISDIVTKKCIKQHVIHIPKGDKERNYLFSDVAPYEKKFIYLRLIDNKDSNNNKEIEFDYYTDVYIELRNMYKISTSIPPNLVLLNKNVEDRLKNIHKNLSIDYGDLNDEYPEQLMVSRFLLGNEKVLEIGSNIGRNSLVIGYILKENKNNDFVTMECDSETCKKLKHNRDKNGMNFHIENAALSKNRIIQRGWYTCVTDESFEGWHEIPRITWDELQDKYKIEFDTLVLDCEGAFYDILIDFPEILKNIKLIIMENDYFHNDNKKEFVDKILYDNNFRECYVEEGPVECRYKNYFYEVWKKISND